MLISFLFLFTPFIEEYNGKESLLKPISQLFRNRYETQIVTSDRICYDASEVIDLENPKVVTDYLEKGSFYDILDEEDYYLGNQLLENEVIENLTIAHPVVDKSLLKHETFIGGNFDKFEVSDTVFSGCDLSNCVLSEGSFYRVTFKNCKLLGTNFDQSFLNNVTFENCLLDMAALNQLNLKTVVFSGCQMKDASFNENKLVKVKFAHCNLNEMTFWQTKLKGLDFSDSEFETIDLDQEMMRGLKVNSEQASFLAQYFLGIKVSY